MQDIEDEVIGYKVHLPSAPQERDDLRVVSFFIMIIRKITTKACRHAHLPCESTLTPFGLYHTIALLFSSKNDKNLHKSMSQTF